MLRNRLSGTISLGFGGDVIASVGNQIWGRHCMMEGPVARLKNLNLADDNIISCLLRAFEHGSSLQAFGEGLRPIKLTTTLTGCLQRVHSRP